VPSARHLVPLGDLDPVTAAPLTDAGLTPYRAVKRVLPRLVPGATAVTIGLGGLGQYGLQYLKLMSAADVAAVDTAPQKRSLAAELGADLVVDPGVGTAGAVASIRQLAPGGAAAVIDYVGSDDTLALAASVVAPQGVIVIVGIAGGALPVSFIGVPTEAVVTTSYWGTPNELREVIALAGRGRLRHDIVTQPLEGASDALQRLQRGEVSGRVVLTP
jgi:propanol-preferring alcohol dehydrogenase